MTVGRNSTVPTINSTDNEISQHYALFQSINWWHRWRI